jgi:hypothetical protein
MGEERKVYLVLVGKPEGKRPYGRPSVGGRMELERILGRMTRVCLVDFVAQDRGRWRALMNAVMNLRVLASWS